MGRRSRQREQRDTLSAPSSRYSDPEAGTLVLRGSLSPGSRRAYAETLGAGRHQEDAWQRAAEFLFEHLAVSWTIAGLEIDRPRELLGRYRLASGAERQFVRDALRRHLAEHFPELQAP